MAFCLVSLPDIHSNINCSIAVMVSADLDRISSIRGQGRSVDGSGKLFKSYSGAYKVIYNKINTNVRKDCDE